MLHKIIIVKDAEDLSGKLQKYKAMRIKYTGSGGLYFQDINSGIRKAKYSFSGRYQELNSI